MTVFGEKMNEALNRAGKSRYWLARKTGITDVQLYRLGRQDTMPRLDTAILIADALGVSLDYLCGR